MYNIVISTEHRWEKQLRVQFPSLSPLLLSILQIFYSSFALFSFSWHFCHMNKKKNMTTQRLLWIVSGHRLWLNLTGCQMSTGFIKCHWELLQAAGKPSRHCIIRVNYIFVCFFFFVHCVHSMPVGRALPYRSTENTSCGAAQHNILQCWAIWWGHSTT